MKWLVGVVQVRMVHWGGASRNGSYNNNNINSDNIFGIDACLTYGPQIQRHTCT